MKKFAISFNTEGTPTDIVDECDENLPYRICYVLPVEELNSLLLEMVEIARENESDSITGLSIFAFQKPNACLAELKRRRGL